MEIKKHSLSLDTLQQTLFLILQRKKTTKQILVGDRARPGIQAQVSLPENTNYANLLNRRYSHSLPSLQTSGKIWRVYKEYGPMSWDDPDLIFGPGMFQ